jgi:imidazolonepropionase
LDEPTELKSLRVAAAVGNCLNIVPTFVARAPSAQFDGRTDLQLDWLCAELLPRIRQKHLAVCVEIVCDPAGMTIDDARTFLAAAGRLGFVLKLEAEQTTRMGAVRLASETDVRSISGMNFCDQFDAEILSRSRTIALLLPARSFQGQTTKSPPARLLIDSGVAVALGSGHSPALPATFSMQPVLSIACSELEMTPEEAISAATINAAHAMNRASISGSLEFGKEADLVVLDVPDYREIPYHLGVNYVAMTMRRGQVVYREGSVTCSGE